jgi:hypothetical protein
MKCRILYRAAPSSPLCRTPSCSLAMACAQPAPRPRGLPSRSSCTENLYPEYQILDCSLLASGLFSASIRPSSSISDLLRSLRMVESWSISSTRLTTSAFEDILSHHLLRFDLFGWKEYPGVPARLSGFLPQGRNNGGHGSRCTHSSFCCLVPGKGRSPAGRTPADPHLIRARAGHAAG